MCIIIAYMLIFHCRWQPLQFYSVVSAQMLEHGWCWARTPLLGDCILYFGTENPPTVKPIFLTLQAESSTLEPVPTFLEPPGPPSSFLETVSPTFGPMSPPSQPVSPTSPTSEPVSQTSEPVSHTSEPLLHCSTSQVHNLIALLQVNLIQLSGRLYWLQYQVLLCMLYYTCLFGLSFRLVLCYRMNYQLQWYLDIVNISRQSSKAQKSCIYLINASVQTLEYWNCYKVFIKNINDSSALIDGSEILASSRFHCNW